MADIDTKIPLDGMHYFDRRYHHGAKWKPAVLHAFDVSQLKLPQSNSNFEQRESSAERYERTTSSSKWKDVLVQDKTADHDT